MFDARKLLDQFVGAAEQMAGKENVDKVRQAVRDNPGLSKAAGVGLAAVLLGTRAGRRLSGRALRLGALAAIGGVAYKAFQQWQQGKSGGVVGAPPAGSPFRHDGEAAQERAKAFLSAMIASAKADGNIDADEQKRIFGKLNEMVDGAEAKAFLMEQMMAPLDFSKIVELAPTREQAVEIYAASVMAVVVDTPAERVYLNTLADHLGLEKELAATVEKAVEEERAAA
jgi:uncharacterized membrane protein YebE (DUF533 family)